MKLSLTIVPFLIIIISCTSQPDKTSKKFILQGEITGQDSGLLVLSYMPGETMIYDSVKVKNGKFVFTGFISEPTRASLNEANASNRVEVLYLEPQKMNISLAKGKFSEHKMTGSKTQNDFDLLQKMGKPFYDKISMLRKQYAKINDSIKDTNNESLKTILEKKTEELDKQWSQARMSIDSTELKFVIENPKSFISVVNLSMLEANEKISLDSAKSIFSGLDNSLKNSSYGKEIVERNRKMENILIGAQAPDFKATDIKQQIVTLSQFKDKSVVLLDFWASWCVPCRESIPQLKKVYQKYHSKGFEVIAVSMDLDKKAWIEAVKQDSTDMWYHIPIAEKYAEGPSHMTNDDIYQNYFVQAIPVQLLIDKNGKVIYRQMGYSKENEESLDSLISGLFND
jgi:peroxiredoxin